MKLKRVTATRIGHNEGKALAATFEEENATATIGAWLDLDVIEVTWCRKPATCRLYQIWILELYKAALSLISAMPHGFYFGRTLPSVGYRMVSC